VKNSERPRVVGFFDGFEVFDFAGLLAVGGDYLAN
jgi:hypothetical protein